MSKEIIKHLEEALNYIDALEIAIEDAGDVVSDAVYENLQEVDFDYGEADRVIGRDVRDL